MINHVHSLNPSLAVGATFTYQAILQNLVSSPVSVKCPYIIDISFLSPYRLPQEYQYVTSMIAAMDAVALTYYPLNSTFQPMSAAGPLYIFVHLCLKPSDQL